MIKVYDLEQLTEFNSLVGHADTIKEVTWISDHTLVRYAVELGVGSKDGRIMLLSRPNSAGDNIRLWDLRMGEKGGEAKQLSVNGPVVSVELSLDGKHLTAVSGKTVHFFDRSSYPSFLFIAMC